MIPNGAIGARFSPDGATLYLTDATGLGIYDVTNPDSPQIRSHVPLPRVDAAGQMHLVDVSDPAAPAIVETRPAPGDLTIYDVRDLSLPASDPAPSDEQLAWVADEDGTFAFDITEARPRVVLGGPGEPRPGHWLLLGALARGARAGVAAPRRARRLLRQHRTLLARLPRALRLPAAGVAWQSR